MIARNMAGDITHNMTHDMTHDRVGLGWRPELAAGILSHLDRIDVVEVIADDWFEASRRKLRELRMLTAQVPVVLHGIGLGMASTIPVNSKKLDAMARLCGAINPESWSEHLAFVRAGETELGHLAAPPRNNATVEGACRNLERARRVIGAAPAVENIATIIQPPGATLGESEWIGRILDNSGCNLLLDLHNVYANARNFGGDTLALSNQVNRGRVDYIHIAGGKFTPEGRILDDHLHGVPDEVYGLLADAAARTARPLTVILERDGNYPPIAEMLNHLELARRALAAGRARRIAS
jgi:uncharacterized protein (UPF0276 family)